MPVLKTKVDGDWVPLVAGRDGPQGPPGPASTPTSATLRGVETYIGG